MVVPPGAPPGQVDHRYARDLPDLLPRHALVVLNDTLVLPARLLGKKAATKGRVEVFLVRPAEIEDHWMVLTRASKPVRTGMEIELNEAGTFRATVCAERSGEGLVEVKLSRPPSMSLHQTLEAFGHIPLPPYIDRPDETVDRDRYQTVFARVPGAIAAPTAGLHFSDALLERCRARGIQTAFVTLHVGLGTFRPVSVANLNDHPMHTEWFDIPESTAAAIRAAKREGLPVVAVGTTVVRALESAGDPDHPGCVRALSGETRLLIQPGYSFSVVDLLLTNFHLPRSTLLALVFAFAGRERTLAAYDAAIAARYRFYSYGDAMLFAREARS